MKNNNGFTLVEVLVALAIGTLMLMAIYSVVNSAQRSSAGIERKVIAQQDARSALELMAMEIRMASYNPNLTPNIWLSTANCFSAATNQSYRGIQEATANALTIEMDIDNSASVGDHENEMIRYNYDLGNQYITRSTNCGAAQPFLGALAANEATKTVLVVNDIDNDGAYTAGADIPVFRYYNGSGTEIPAPVTTSIPDIRRVEVTLVLDTVYVDPNTGVRKRIIYSTSVIPRNHIPSYSY